MGWTRSSSTYRELVCPGSLILPRVESKPNEGSEWGHVAHNWAATGRVEPTKLGLFPNHVSLFQRKLEYVKPDRLALWPATGQHEVGIAINCLKPEVEWITGLDADQLDKWKEQWPDHYLTGALDYLGEVLDDPWVDDLKTGKRDDPRDESPRRRSQVWTYAVAAYLIRQRLRNPAGRIITSITWWPRYPVDSEPLRIFQSINDSECEHWWRHLNKKYTGLVQLRKRPETLEPLLRDGHYCFFCPSKQWCPIERRKNEQREWERFSSDFDAD